MILELVCEWIVKNIVLASKGLEISSINFSPPHEIWKSVEKF